MLGQKCVAYTDNNPLSHLSTAEFGTVEQCWALELSNFDHVIKYRPGKRNDNADAFSQQCLLGVERSIKKKSVPFGTLVTVRGACVPLSS